MFIKPFQHFTIWLSDYDSACYARRTYDVLVFTNGGLLLYVLLIWHWSHRLHASSMPSYCSFLRFVVLCEVEVIT